MWSLFGRNQIDSSLFVGRDDCIVPVGDGGGGGCSIRGLARVATAGLGQTDGAARLGQTDGAARQGQGGGEQDHRQSCSAHFRSLLKSVLPARFYLSNSISAGEN